MKVLFIASEAAPFAKMGGLADVVASLPKALRQQGIDARVIIPAYGTIDWYAHNIKPLFTFDMHHRTGAANVTVAETTHDGVPFYFVKAWPYLGDGNYVYTDVNWDIRRFIYFSQAVMGTAWELGQRFAWFPDVFHVHDWHTSLVSFLLAQNRQQFGSPWRNATSMITIHNMGYQGWEGGEPMRDFGVPERTHPDLVYQDLTDNLLAIGLAYSDEITVVSPRYADEIQYPHFGAGLEGLIRIRAEQGNLYGILNGIDVERYNPASDPHIVQNFDSSSLSNRIINKRELQRESGLETRDEVPLIGLVSRLVWAKGIDLAAPALRHLLASEEVQFVALGTGEEEVENAIWLLGHHFHWKARTYIEFDAALAQRIYAGCDMFLMPSRYEPCGIGQMLAMRYGALPIVRETGGLADTVENYDSDSADTGTGFTFLWEDSDAVLNTLRWAISTYRYRKDAWRRMQDRGMQTDFSWKRSAREYIQRYERGLAQQRTR